MEALMCPLMFAARAGLLHAVAGGIPQDCGDDARGEEARADLTAGDFTRGAARAAAAAAASVPDRIQSTESYSNRYFSFASLNAY